MPMNDDAGPSRPAASRASASEPPMQETVKETFESIIIAFVLAFVFRAYVVEAFVIPTGSMAPTLLGAHLSVTCDQCGYGFDVDVPSHSKTGQGYNQRAAALEERVNAVCPMCRFPNILPAGTRPSSGDRILVQKYIYQLSEPRRYDVVVFKDPKEPDRNFIKRLVGLPGEALYLFEGDIYTRPTGSDAPFQIARKTKRPEVQRAVWQPIYDSRYIPLDGGRDPERGPELTWAPPWQASEHPKRWTIDGHRSYTYRGTEPGRIAFSFANLGYQTAPRPGELIGRYPYNQLKYDNRSQMLWEPIEDVRLAAIFQPERDGLAVRLTTTARVDQEGTKTLSAAIDADGRLRLIAGGQTLATEQLAPFSPGENRQVEFWYVDHEASVWVDGERVMRVRFDPTLEQLLDRDPPAPLPEVSIGVSGSPVTLHQVQLDRDIYYSIQNSSSPSADGGLWRTSGDSPEPKRLEADEFFCVGDNTPWSHDSRYWDEVDPWVQQRFLEGERRLGVVPRELMMGRAFFVYYPAPYALWPTAPKVFPNFGDMRFIH